VPQSIEAFYQEAGRAGRDGAPARALLFAESRDKGLHVFFIERSGVEDAQLTGVARRLAATEGRYDITAGALAAAAGCDEEQVRSIVGHLARAGVLQPAPSAPDRVTGRVLAPMDGRALAACRTSAGDAQRARWRQYRAVWAFVEGSACRRRAILRHFGDHAEPAPTVACCDVCDPTLVPAAPAARGARAGSGTGAPADLDGAILEVVGAAEPQVGRTRAVEILRGGRSQVVRRHAYDGLPGYGAFGHLSSDDVLTRVDELLAAGRLRSTGGRFPKLEAA